MARSTIVRGGDDPSDQYLKCRTWGHAWDSFAPLGMAPPSFGWRESLRCTRCTMERHFTISSRDEVAVRDYRPPEGYARPKGSGPLLAAEKRKRMFEMLRDQLAKAEAISPEMAKTPRRNNVVPMKRRQSA